MRSEEDSGVKPFWLKVHRVERYGIEEIIVAICDKELIGRRIEDGDVCFYINPRFYKGSEASEREIMEAMEKATIANLVGRKAVEVGIKAGFIDRANVIEVKGIPHAQFVII